MSGAEKTARRAAGPQPPRTAAPPAQTLFRLRVRHPKRGRLIYLGHLELIHSIERVVRRAALPYAVSQGFSPHMRMGFSSALPVGTGSVCEYFDVFLTELVPAGEALARLRASSPADIEPDAARYVGVRDPALTAEITRQEYLVELERAEGAAFSAADVGSALAEVRSLGGIAYERGKKRKVLDLSRTLAGFTVGEGASGCVEVELATRCDNKGALRPEILLCALDRRLRHVGADEEGAIRSTGVPELPSFARFSVTRRAQWVETAEGLVSPLGARAPQAHQAR